MYYTILRMVYTACGRVNYGTIIVTTQLKAVLYSVYSVHCSVHTGLIALLDLLVACSASDVRRSIRRPVAAELWQLEPTLRRTAPSRDPKLEHVQPLRHVRSAPPCTAHTE